MGFEEGRAHSWGAGRGGVFTREVTSELACKDCRSLGGGERGEGKHSRLREQHVQSHGGVKGQSAFQNGQDWVWLEGRVWGWRGRGRKQSRDSLLCPFACLPVCLWLWLWISNAGDEVQIGGWPGVRRAD